MTISTIDPVHPYDLNLTWAVGVIETSGRFMGIPPNPRIVIEHESESLVFRVASALAIRKKPVLLENGNYMIEKGHLFLEDRLLLIMLEFTTRTDLKVGAKFILDKITQLKSEVA